MTGLLPDNWVEQVGAGRLNSRNHAPPPDSESPHNTPNLARWDAPVVRTIFATITYTLDPNTSRHTTLPGIRIKRVRASLVIVCPFLIQAFPSALASLFPIIVSLGLFLGFTEPFSSGFYGFASLLLQRSGERVSNICWVCVPFVVGLAQDSEVWRVVVQIASKSFISGFGQFRF